jgi:hypothetical protein
MRVLHGPVNIGNQPWMLSRYERQLGVRSDVVVNYDTWIHYPVDRIIGEYGSPEPQKLRKRFRFGLNAPFRYDVMHYYFGRTFLSWDDFATPLPESFTDLRVARWLGRKIFMTFQGCDVRQSDHSTIRNKYTMCQLGHCQVAEHCRASHDKKRRQLLQEILPYIDRAFVLNPELAHEVPGAVFLPYLIVDVDAVKTSLPRTEGPITILHAPSDESIKGTRYILPALENLKKRWPIEVVLVKGLPHHEAVKLYPRADLVIDQVLAGWYGAFAVEMMAMGKPVACYIRDEDLHFIPASMRAELPLLRVTPDTIEADLETYLQQRLQWPEWGRRSRAFALRWHNPRHIAAAMLRAYRDPASRFDLEGEIHACAA